MKVKLDSRFTTFSGSANDTTFLPSKSGQLARERVDPSQPRTARQLQVRSRFSGNSVAWKGITDVQRTGWRNLAAQVNLTGRFGDSFHPTGQQLYVSLNGVLDEVGAVQLDTAPAAPPAITAASITSAAAAAGANTVTLVLSAIVAGEYAIISMAAQRSPGREYISPSDYRILTTYTFAAGPPTAAALGTLYEAKFGNLTAGLKIALKFEVVSANGFKSAPAYNKSIIVAA